VQVLFRAASRRTAGASCPRIGLSSDLCREIRGGLPGVDVVMAGGADHECLASSRHECRPRGLGRSLVNPHASGHQPSTIRSRPIQLTPTPPSDQPARIANTAGHPVIARTRNHTAADSGNPLDDPPRMQVSVCCIGGSGCSVVARMFRTQRGLGRILVECDVETQDCGTPECPDRVVRNRTEVLSCGPCRTTDLSRQSRPIETFDP
jgi:hypothetical protein